eukprot:jgi/Tetstr1/444265/TSEL_032157.t1
MRLTLRPLAVNVQLVVGSAGSTVRGLLPAAHLFGPPAGAAALGARLAVGSQLGELVVLELQPGRGTALVSRKASLRGAATSLPSPWKMLAEGAIHPGYVASVTADAVYVRFLARLTARAGLSQLADTFVSDPQQHFQPGQSVRAQVVQIDVAHGKFGVTLKPSLTASKDSRLLASLFADYEAADALSAPEGEPVDWASAFAIGSAVDGQVHELKDYGVVCDLNGHEDLLGLVAHHQAADELTPGQQIAGRVLDVNKQDGILDLTLKPKLCKQPKKAAKAAKALPLGEKVEGVVELIKPDYVVVSLPDAHGALGFVPAKDYNLHLIDAHKHFSLGQKLSATVSCQASPETGGRLLLHLPLHTSPDTTPRSNAKGGRIQSGGVLNGQVANVHAMHAMVKLGDNLPQARLHISQIWDTDANAEADSNPLDELVEGQPVEVAVLGNLQTAAGRGHGVLEVSMRPADVAGAKARRKPKVLGYADLRPGTCLRGFSQEIVGDHLWVALGPNIRGRLDLLDCGAEPEELAGAARLYKPGTPLRVHVVGVTGEGRRQHVDLSLREPGAAAAGTPPLAAGQLVVARVVAVQPDTGLQVQLAGGVRGRVAVTDIHDVYVKQPLEGLLAGTFVRGRVLAVDAEGHADLSLRRSVGGWWDGCEADVGAPAAAGEAPPELTAAALAAGDDVKGYVRAVTAKGMFVNLSRRLQGRVKLSHLSDGFVDDPKAAFPAGSLVAGRVLGVEGGRVELTLKSPGAGGSRNALVDLEGLEVGQTVLGKVKRVEKFGVFVQLDRSTAAGLAHISELDDGFMKDVKQAYQPGQAVRAKVLRLDRATCRLSLGLKPSYFDGQPEATGGAEAAGAADFDEEAEALMDSEEEEEEEDAMEVDESDGEASEGDEDGDDGEGSSDGEDAAAGIDDAEWASEVSDEDAAAGPGDTFMSDSLSAAADMGWGEVVLGEQDGAGAGPGGEEGEEGQPGEGASKKTKAAKKREAREREAAVRRAELARLEGGAAPASKEAFEQAVMASPNSSYVWIKFVAFLLSLGEADAARAVAERALSTIGQREESERFNVWVAYINMENLYGEPPEEAVMELLQRALQYTNQKRLYLAALGIFQRTERTALCDQVLKAVCRKFGESAKVWLRAYSYHIECGKPDAAKRALDRGLTSLPNRKHIKVLRQVGILEFKSGDAERARSIFENVLRNYPKRLDLWSVYLDQEIRLGDLQRCRSLFERVTYLQLPPKKMKFFFKRYLDFEKSHGTAATVAHVKQRAMEFVEGIKAGE